MNKRRTDGGMELLEAKDYAIRLREDVDVMLNPKTGFYHVIRLYAVEHYSKFYATVLEVRVKIQIKNVQTKKIQLRTPM